MRLELVPIGSAGIDQDFRTWLNSGLMTLFFLVVGLEARREFDLGDLRDRRRFVLPAPRSMPLQVSGGRPAGAIFLRWR